MSTLAFPTRTAADAFAAEAKARGCGAVVYTYPDGSADVGIWDRRTA